MKLEFELEKSGWATLRIHAPPASVSARVSWMTDTPTELLTACCSLLLANEPARFHCVEEPGEYRFILQREGPRIHIRILYFPVMYSHRLPDSKGDNRESMSGDLREFLASVAETMRSCYTSIGPEEYKRRWCRGYPFPVATLLRLEQLLGEL